MAENINLPMFTNAGITYNGNHLLQQAIQEVVTNGQGDNSIVAFFKTDTNEQQTIRLTQEQAAALGLTSEVDSLQGKTNSVLTESNEFYLNGESLEEEGNDNLDFPVEEWIQEVSDSAGNQEAVSNHQIAKEIAEFEASEDAKEIRTYLLQNHLKLINKKTPEIQQPPRSVQKMPVILPQSQFITVAKPLKTVVKTARNVRLLTTPKQVPITTTVAPSVVPQNSLLVSNVQKLNGISTQASRNGTQLLNGGQQVVANGPGRVVLKNTPRKTNPQQIFVTKPAEGVKNIKIHMANGQNGTPGILKTTTGTINRPIMPSIVKSNNSQVILTSRMTNQELTTVITNNGVVRPQIAPSSVSILKPQPKINGNAQNANQMAKKNVKKIVKPPVEKKVVQNYVNGNVQGNLVTNGIEMMPKIVNRLEPTEQSDNGVQSDSEKIGSAQQPIQIVQQGNTFHSSHKLTQNQLRQIAQVLQARDPPESMEKVVYRVVFPRELDLTNTTTTTTTTTTTMTAETMPVIKAVRAKRGRPKKAPGKNPPAKQGLTDEETEEAKDDRKKVVARTRSGRLSRPPKHMVQHYKHLHPVDFMQPDLDDSDGGYSDYNTNSLLANAQEAEEPQKELLTGLELPKRKVSTHFRCSTCNKIYLGRARMAKHFELFPDHGSIELLPPEPCAENEVKKSPNPSVDPFKRKGKKRGPWAYVTPEAKSERRQTKLREAISVCDSEEISKIAAMPVLNAQSLYDLMALKSDNNVRTFLQELKSFMGKIREQAGVMLSPISNKENNNNAIQLNDDLLCDALGLAPGIYRVNDDVFKKPETVDTPDDDEPPMKIQKLHSDEGKENIEERLSSGCSESSDLSVSDFLADRKQDPNCPDVLTALTLIPRNSSPITEANKNVSKLLISSPQIQKQISDNPGFQKVDINGSKSPTFRKIETTKENFAKLTESLDLPTCSPIFTKIDNFEQQKMDNSPQGFIRLEPMQQNFIKLEQNQTGSGITNGFHNLTDDSQNFTKGFQKIIGKMPTMESDPINSNKNEELKSKNICKDEQHSLPLLQDTDSMISTSCDTGLFGNHDNLDSITNLDLEQLHLVDPENVVDELVSERLKNIMPDNILDNNLMPNSTTSLDTELDFEALSEEFNRNTRS